jgi:hypothetical protein
MARIMVSVLYEPTGEKKDFEIPNRMFASDFGQKIAEVFEGKILSDPTRFWFEVGAVAVGKYLRADETLQQAGVWDGEIILVSKQLKAGSSLQPEPGPQAGPAMAGAGSQALPGPSGQGPAGNPTAKWKELDIAVHKEERKSGIGRTFIWKKAD